MKRDPQAWLRDLEVCAPENRRVTLERALEVWPASTELWTIYVQSLPETQTANEESRSDVLARCLPLSVDPRLYELYLAHVRASSPDELDDAFEFVVDSVSCDPSSGTIWKQYIDYLAGKPTANEWEEQFRRDKVRKAYKRAVALPLSNVTALWQQYVQFETRISRISARKFTDERSPAYMKARQAYQTYQALAPQLNTSTMQSPITSVGDAVRWREYIAWEAANPLELEPEELAVRVRFACRRATNCARFAPQLWFAAGLRCSSSFYADGARAMPESYLLALKLAEHEELLSNWDGTRAALTTLATAQTNLEQNPTPAWAQLARAAHRMQGCDAARAIVRECAAEVDQPTADIYIAAASIEEADGQVSKAFEVWSAAYRQFGSKPEGTVALPEQTVSFVGKYIDFLFSHGSAINARSVFVKAVQQLPPGVPALRDLYEHMLAAESRHAGVAGGGLRALEQLEQQYVAQFDADLVDLFAKRFGSDAGMLFGAELTPKKSADVTVPQTTDSAVKQLFPENSLFAGLVDSLPGANLYNGPRINVPLLLKLVREAPI